MKTGSLRTVTRHTYGFSHKEVVAAIRAYLEKKGCSLNTGISYVIGLERQSGQEDEPVLTLVVDKMPNVMKPCGVGYSSQAAREVRTSGRVAGQQKFELTHKGVREALSAACDAAGKPLPDGPVTLWGLDEPIMHGDRNGYSDGCPALTLYVDPS